jgi:hypothetical protein
MKKKGWLDYLYYKIGKQNCDFYLQYSEKDGIKTKWKKYSEACFDYETPKNRWFLERVNQRQILPNEIVLDLEEKSQLPIAKKLLDKFGWTNYIFSTGSRGYHIHIFFDKDLTDDSKKFVIRAFGADMMKAGKKTLIALEYSKHWKSGKEKVMVGEENGI